MRGSRLRGRKEGEPRVAREADPAPGLPEKIFFWRADPLTTAVRYLAILGLLLAMAGCIQEAGHPGLEFSTRACTREIEPYVSPEAGVLDTGWENGSTLVVNGYVKTFCGGAEISGDYTLSGDTIILFYNITTPGEVTRCLCAHGVVYRIAGITMGEYRIVMEKR
jgi:hypothetical protein